VVNSVARKYFTDFKSLLIFDSTASKSALNLARINNMLDVKRSVLPNVLICFKGGYFGYSFLSSSNLITALEFGSLQ